jgi:hypothetical protein
VIADAAGVAASSDFGCRPARKNPETDQATTVPNGNYLIYNGFLGRRRIGQRRKGKNFPFAVQE